MPRKATLTHPSSCPDGTAPVAGSKAPCAAAKKKKPTKTRTRRVVRIRAKVATTQSVRGAHSIAPPFTHHNFASTSSAKALGSNTPTVVVRNCADIELEADTDPPNQADVVWTVEPNPGPASPAPGLTSSGTKATLKTDAGGGYAVTASLDGTKVIWNLVIVDVKVNSFAIQRNGANFTDRSSAAQVFVSSGIFDITQPAKCAMYTKAEISLFAGGDPSLDAFCDKVHVGIVNNLLEESAAAQYQRGGRERERITSVPIAVQPVVDPAVNLIDLGFPILDRGGDPATRATGGDTIFLRSTQSTPPSGLDRVVESCDSPAVSFDPRQPRFNAPARRRILTVSGTNGFKIYLVAFSDDANFSYVAFGHAPWTADYSGRVRFPGGGNPPRWTKTTAGVRGSGLATIRHGQEAKAASCEVCRPTFLDNLTIDAR